MCVLFLSSSSLTQKFVKPIVIPQKVPSIDDVVIVINDCEWSSILNHHRLSWWRDAFQVCWVRFKWSCSKFWPGSSSQSSCRQLSTFFSKFHFFSKSFVPIFWSASAPKYRWISGKYYMIRYILWWEIFFDQKYSIIRNILWSQIFCMLKMGDCPGTSNTGQLFPVQEDWQEGILWEGNQNLLYTLYHLWYPVLLKMY